jgi:predicted deacetylase
MSATLFASVSAISDATRGDCARFAAQLDRRGVPLSLLVSPRLRAGYRLAEDPATQEFLRERRASGDAIVLHGYDRSATERRRAEFSTLGRHEARLRLIAADRVLEQAGLRTRVFAAPRWNASTGALAALPDAGFRMNLGYTAITDLTTGEESRARVLGIGDGFLSDRWWCRAVIAGANRTARRGGTLRLAIDARQLSCSTSRRTVLDAIDLALHHGARAQSHTWRERVLVAA